MTSSDLCPWARQTGERDSSYIKFMHFLHQGTGRSQAETARAFGVSRASINETALRGNWVARAQAWDASPQGSHGDVSSQLQALATQALAPAATGEAKTEGNDHLEALEDFRQAAEALSRDQVKLGRAATAAAGRGLTALLRSDRPLSARDIAALAGVGAQLGAAGMAGWGRAIGVDVLLAKMRTLQSLSADVEVIDG